MIDQTLWDLATDRQRQFLKAIEEFGSTNAAAKSLGLRESTIRRSIQSLKIKAAQRGYAPEHGLLHTLPEGLELKGTSILYDANGKVEAYWNRSRLAGREEEETIQLPDPKKIVKSSKLYDQTGKVIQQWVTEKVDDIARETLWQAFADGLRSELPRVKPIKAPKEVHENLLAAYPVGDHHFGMLSWHQETGEDYDLKIAEELLMGATDYLVKVAPPCRMAMIALLGDFMHYDGMEPVTPTNKHMLDADGRFGKMVSAAIRSTRAMINLALLRHKFVHIKVAIGNHDPSSTIFLAQCLAAIYENEPRVTVDTSPSHFLYFEFGKCLIGVHHGHGAKMDDLPLIMATDQPDAWGRTRHRYWWTGHIHHGKMKSVISNAQDYAGCTVESFRVLAPPDAWAAGKGYRSVRDMKAIILHAEHGEVARHTVNPEMLQ